MLLFTNLTDKMPVPNADWSVESMLKFGRTMLTDPKKRNDKLYASPYYLAVIAVHTDVQSWNAGPLETFGYQFLRLPVLDQERVIETLWHFKREDWIAHLRGEALYEKERKIELMRKKETVVDRMLCDLSKRSAQ